MPVVKNMIIWNSAASIVVLTMTGCMDSVEEMEKKKRQELIDSGKISENYQDGDLTQKNSR